MSHYKTEVESDDSLSDDSLEVSEDVTNVTSITNVTSETILESPEKEKISCALCVTRNKGKKAWIEKFQNPCLFHVLCLLSQDMKYSYFGLIYD